MSKFKWINKSYKMKFGNWVPEVQLCEETSEGMEVSRLLAPEARQFQTEAESIAYCEIMVSKWIKLT